MIMLVMNCENGWYNSGAWWIYASCAIGLFVSSGSTVTTSSDAGTFVGILDSSIHKNGVTRFLGIPYAIPPIGQRRFERPAPVEKIQTPYNATFHRPHCPQTLTMNPSVKYFSVSEDCLHLNIYVPGTTVLKTNKYPVMIWIYGGRFHYGGADVYSGDVISASNDVIVVTFNYRMNAFGFLSDGTKASGNYGLWDQKLAIEWVNKNIASFGGDVSRVTLFGQSAGAASVLFQALHVGNKGLFNRVIAQSGSPLASWALQNSPAEQFTRFVARVGCRSVDNKAVTKCLKSKSADLLLKNVDEMDSFVPAIDVDFIKEHPKLLFSNKSKSNEQSLQQFGELDFLTGVASKDGASAITSVWGPIMRAMGNDISTGVSKSFFEKIFMSPTLGASLCKPVSPTLKASVLHEYTDWSKPGDPIIIRDNMIDLCTDLFFLIPTIIVANKHQKIATANSKRTYLYEFDHKPPFVPKPFWLQGANHGMDVPYVFGLVNSLKLLAGLSPDADIPIPEADAKLAALMTKMWTNFAKSGDPNTPEHVSSSVSSWPTYNTDAGAYEYFSTNGTEARGHIGGSRVAFWTKLIPVLDPCNSKTEASHDNSISMSPVTHFNSSIIFIYVILQLLKLLSVTP